MSRKVIRNGVETILFTAEERRTISSEILSLSGPATPDKEHEVIRFVARQCGRQTQEEADFFGKGG